LILIGRIVDAHGIRGAVKLVSLATLPADIRNYRPLLSSDGRSFVITKMKPAKDCFIADLDGVRDRNAAEALKGTDLFVTREQLPPTPEGETYLADLEGKDIVVNGTSLGRVVGFQNYGAGELIELAEGLLVPLRFVTRVDDVVHVELPEGYLDAAVREDEHH
jgi:16S rRNA processing protein RimM